MQKIFNFTFSCLIIINLLLLIFITPFVFFEYDSVPVKEGASSIASIFMVAAMIFFSFKAYYHGIEMDDTWLRTHRGRMSPGDKEFFAFFSKPIAFALILFVSFIHALALKEILLR